MPLLFGSEHSALSCPVSSGGAVLPSACPSPNTRGCSTGGVQAGYLRQRCSSCALLQRRCSYVAFHGTGSSFNTTTLCTMVFMCLPATRARCGHSSGAVFGRWVSPRRPAAPRARPPPPPPRRGWGSLCGPKRQSAGALLGAPRALRAAADTFQPSTFFRSPHPPASFSPFFFSFLKIHSLSQGASVFQTTPFLLFPWTTYAHLGS